MGDVVVKGVHVGNTRPLTIIAGPCQLERRDHALRIAEHMAQICAAHGLGYIFKGSYDKANRTSLSSARGPGMTDGLEMLAAVRDELGVPVLTDVHLPDQCAEVAAVVDILQIPAFLCRQTDLLTAAAKTGIPINVKKGQFLAPWDMEHVVNKITASGNQQLMLTERGTSFGYNTLVTDMRGLAQMVAFGHPVIMDATHAVQMPGGQGRASGGQREFAPVLARAAVSLGIAGVFLETHPDPASAPSDGPNMVPLDQMAALVADLAAFDQLARQRPLRPI
ncbi:2-dehydro-3-deoxyphosphooctonate aldolase [Aliiroseovarius zhejiangensis]|uniref:2-dehydro-3-deoxyphosphooctonate aldolase n=1 Tax=Aliiroseovarius zhejiangensis TaxID=1632025 RepID=A0ABQ3IPL9_9RHOB|nr:3-deoxy-8-phosphooctulonate synthase [Aliiroseovarius zhejiangensis]GHE89945.1 2-dehydro-3-deoxyphosphooctonate aldolase [Aliiroseovarius zhejiangensis]